MSDQANRLRVLVVSLGRRGGVTRYGQLMAEGLENTCEVAAISATTAENRTKWARLGDRHLETVTFSSVGTMLASFFAVGRFLRMRAFAKAFAPDVIYYPGGHAWKPVLDLVLPRAAKVVLTVHDPEPHPGEDTTAARMLAWANRLRVDGYVLLNAAQRDSFIQRHHLDSSRIVTIPLGVFDDLLHAERPLADVPGLERVAAVSGRYLLFVGRIHRYKGLKSLLTAYSTLPTASRLPLVIAGAGTFSDAERSLLASSPRDQVIVVNHWLDDVELASLAAAARFVVLPYVAATQSGVIPLASAFGVPAIASDAGALAEQVVDGRTGWLYPAGDVQALAAALSAAVAMNEEDHDAMARECLQHARSEWAWSLLAQRLHRFFTTLVAS